MEPPPLVVSVDVAAVPVLHLDGRLDSTTTPVLRTEAARILLVEPHDVVIECSRLTVLDGAGLRALRDIRRRLPRTGEVVVVGATASVLDILRRAAPHGFAIVDGSTSMAGAFDDRVGR